MYRMLEPSLQEHGYRNWVSKVGIYPIPSHPASVRIAPSQKKLLNELFFMKKAYTGPDFGEYSLSRL